MFKEISDQSSTENNWLISHLQHIKDDASYGRIVKSKKRADVPPGVTTSMLSL